MASHRGGPRRKDAEPRARVLHREQIPVRNEGDATVRVLVGPSKRFTLMAGKPYGEAPLFNGPFVD